MNSSPELVRVGPMVREPSVQFTVRIPLSRIGELDMRASDMGITRSALAKHYVMKGLNSPAGDERRKELELPVNPGPEGAPRAEGHPGADSYGGHGG